MAGSSGIVTGILAHQGCSHFQKLRDLQLIASATDLIITAWRKARIIVDSGRGPSNDEPTPPAPTA